MYDVAPELMIIHLSTESCLLLLTSTVLRISAVRDWSVLAVSLTAGCWRLSEALKYCTVQKTF